MRHKNIFRQREVGFNVKSVNDNGTFSGYGSVFGETDSYSEIVAPGAFTESLKEIEATGRPLPALWQHDTYAPIGGYDKLSEDEHGLAVEGFLLKDEVAQAREAYALMKRKVVSGLSIGYWVRESSFDEKSGIRTLTRLDLVEVSIVTFPANDLARVEAVKSKLAYGALPTMPEFEKYLREAGFSKTQAASIASRGLGPLLRSESESGGEFKSAIPAVQEALASLQSLSKP